MGNLSKRFVVGIDPGKETGVAQWDGEAGGYWMSAGTTNFHGVMNWAESMKSEVERFIVVVECAKSLPIYRNKYGDKEAGAAQAQARNIGENNRESELLIGELRRRGFEVVEYVPRSTWKDKVAKWTQEECKNITGYAGRTNQHVRDALRFAWEHRHLLRAKTIS